MNRSAGFTIAEVLMALSVASVIALAAGGVATGLAYSYQHQDDYRQSVQDASGVMRELRTVVSKAQLIPSVWGGGLIVWADANADMAFTLSELTLIQYSASTKQVTEKRLIFPASWTHAQIALSDTPMTLTASSNLFTLLLAFTLNGNTQTLVLAEDVQAFSVTGSAGGSNNNVVQASITVGTGAKQFTLRSEMALRASLIGKV
ncbi:MAG: prepilin-type N-terminal cleavage/methylation domain-containing protein [Planctomycetota bacterium]|nr:prepilin-type N-terminal cleavage/methylation domain-containing protein [Planctomycetota bacterium]